MQEARSYIGKTVEVTIDRPLGSKHPKYDNIYPINYGFLKGVRAGDGEDLDAFILGIDKPLKEFTGVCIAVVHRKDDNEEKLVVVPEGTELTDEEIMKAIHFQEKWFNSELVRS